MSQRPRLPILLVCVLVALPTQLIVHECGQIVLARLTGDPDATLRHSQWHPSGAMGGWTAEYDATRLTAVGRMLVPVGGLLFTQSVALGILLVSARRSQRSRAYAAAAAGSFAIDVALQLGRAIAVSAAHGPYSTGVDLEDASRAIFGVTGVSVVAVRVALAVCALAYGLAMWRVIRRRLRGRSWAA